MEQAFGWVAVGQIKFEEDRRSNLEEDQTGWEEDQTGWEEDQTGWEEDPRTTSEEDQTSLEVGSNQRSSLVASQELEVLVGS